MKYSKKFNLEHVDLTEDNVLRLAKIIETQFEKEVSYSEYTVSFFDDSKISSNSKDVFSEYEFKNKCIKRIKVHVTDKEDSRIIVELYSEFYNEIVIESCDKKWFNCFCNEIEEFINTLKQQRTIFKIRYKKKNVLFFIVIFYIIVDILFCLFFKKFLPSLDYYTIAIFLTFFSVLSSVFLFDFMDKAYPVVAFDFGIEENKEFLKYRNVIAWIYSSLIIPVVLDVILYFLL